MKKMRIMAAMAAAMCLMSGFSAYAASDAPVVYQPAFVLEKDTADAYTTISSFLWDSETQSRRINAYTSLKDKDIVEVHSLDSAILDVVREFVKESGLNEDIIEYVLDGAEEQLTGCYIPDGMTVDITPAAPDIVRKEVAPALTEQLKFIYGKLQQFEDPYSTIFYNEGINDSILFTSLDQETVDKVKAYIKENGIDETLVTVDVMVNEESVISGDANCDTAVNMADSVLIMQSLANPDKYQLTAQGKYNADTDRNGITNTDALNIQKKLLKLS